MPPSVTEENMVPIGADAASASMQNMVGGPMHDATINSRNEAVIKNEPSMNGANSMNQYNGRAMAS